MTSTPGSKPRVLRLPAALKARRTRQATIASALLLVAGLIAGIAGITAASGAGGSHPVTINLTYSCRFPSGTYQVSAVAAATFPSTAAAGTPIQPVDLELTMTLPTQAVAYLRGLGAASVSAAASLAVTATSGGTPVPATWPVQTATAAALPATGTSSLDTSGTVPPAAASAPGTVTFAATGLAFELTPQRAGGAATRPATVAATCHPGSTGISRLASIVVTGPSPTASSSPSRTAKPSSTTPVTSKSRLPKGCGRIKVHGDGQAVCGYIVGYSDVKKLYGAALIGPVLVNVDFAYRHVIRHHQLIAYSTAFIYNKADKGKAVFPPVRDTFLGFGFVPVTATLTLTERGPINIVSDSGITKPPYPITVTATSRVAITISNVRVNGVPLAVGPGCQAAHTAQLKLVGHGTNTFPPHGYTVPTGGALAGELTIPSFVHCGVTQNLDPLLTGSISGVGNFAKMTQGKLCGPAQPAAWTCPPPVPKPHR